MKQHYKRIVAGLLTAAMIVPAAASLAEPLSASGYEVLGESDFDWKMYPWHTVSASPAKQIFDLQDGAAHICILVPDGAERAQWDLQFRHKGLDFKEGHEYQISFKVKSLRSGMELSSHIGEIGGDYEQYFVLDGHTGDMHQGPHMGGQWGSYVRLTGEYQEFSGKFVPTADIKNAEWVFNYANDSIGYGGNAQQGDELWFDEMHIEDLSDPDYVPPVETYGYTVRKYSGLENNLISVNQLGYYPGLEKTATLGDDAGAGSFSSQTVQLTGSYDFEIVKVSDDTVVYTGKTGEPAEDDNSGDTVCKIDFTAFDQPGEYYIRIKDKKWRSFPFRIGTDIYQESGHDLLTNALNYFYQNRAGDDVEAKYITSGKADKLAHRSEHDEAVGFVQKEWHNDLMSKAEDAELHASSRIDTSGGWFTRSDYEKDMTESGISLWTLQNMYERASQSEAGKAKFADGSGTVVIPETGNAYPDILDECRYELDYMSKMKVQPDEKTWGDYAGLYYHKLTGVGFRADMPAYEHEYHSAYAVQPPTFAATLHYAACAAQGARLWAPYDEAYAAELLAAAKDAYQAYKTYWYEAKRGEMDDPTSLYGPSYYMGVDIHDYEYDVQDEAYWAACELFLTAKAAGDAGADAYFTDLSEYRGAFQIPVSVYGDGNELFDSESTAAAGTLSLMLHADLLSAEQKETLEQAVLKAAECCLIDEAKQCYGSAYHWEIDRALPNGLDYTPLMGYEYNSNGKAGNNMIALAYAYDLTGDVRYLNGVAAGMDYLFGNNPMAFSYITGYGSYHVQNPAHRYWRAEQDDSLPSAPDGVLVSGPNARVQDLYAKALGYPPVYEGSDVNSQRYYVDSVESWSTNEANVSSNAALAWIVSFMQDEAPAVNAEPTEVVPGDANRSGAADVSDAVALTKYLYGAGILKAPAAVDLNKDGKLTAADLTLLKRMLLSLRKEETV